MRIICCIRPVALQIGSYRYETSRPFQLHMDTVVILYLTADGVTTDNRPFSPRKKEQRSEPHFLASCVSFRHRPLMKRHRMYELVAFLQKHHHVAAVVNDLPLGRVPTFSDDFKFGFVAVPLEVLELFPTRKTKRKRLTFARYGAGANFIAGSTILLIAD